MLTSTKMALQTVKYDFKTTAITKKEKVITLETVDNLDHD